MSSRSSRLIAAVSVVGLTLGATLGLASPAMATATVSSTVLTTGYAPTYSAYNPAGTIVAVANSGSSSENIDSSVDFIDVATNTVVSVTDVELTDAQGIVWSPDGTKVYVLNNSGGIVVIDAASQAIVGTLVSGVSAANYGLAITPNGQFLLTTDYNAGSSAIVDIAANTYTTITMSNTDGWFNVFVSPDGSKAYFMGYYGAVDVVDLTDPAYPVTATLQFENMSYGGISGCSSFDGATLFMADYNDGTPATVARLDLATGTSISTTALMSESIGCAMTPDGKNVLFGAYGEDTSFVYEFDATTLAAVTTYTLAPNNASDVLASSTKVCDVYVSNYYETTNILNFDCSALPDTGASPSVIGTSLAVSAGLLVAGALALIVVRRRNTAHSR
jgi:LPXTG-motif cell wall-anchored protein